jgi:hypothetical protein
MSHVAYGGLNIICSLRLAACNIIRGQEDRQRETILKILIFDRSAVAAAYGAPRKRRLARKGAPFGLAPAAFAYP